MEEKNDDELAEIDILDLPIEDDDSGATTIREYLKSLLMKLWEEGGGFSGKRPFGKSGWKQPVEIALIKAGIVEGTLDADGYVQESDDTMDQIILDVIEEIFK